MNSALTIAIIAGLGGMLGWGFADFFAKKTIDVIGPIPTLVWAHLFGTVTLIIFAIARALMSRGGIVLPAHLSTWLGLLFFGCLQMVVYWLAYEGFGKGQLAVLNPVFASYSGLVALISVIAFGEAFSPWLALGLVVIFGGLMLLNIDPNVLGSKKLKIVPGLKEVAIAALLATFWTLYWDKFVNGQDALSYALFMYAFMSLAAVALARALKVKVGKVKPDLKKFLVLIGVAEAVAYVSISWGYSATSLTAVVALISGSFSLPTLILSHAFLKERVTRLQTIGALIIVGGIILVSLK